MTAFITEFDIDEAIGVQLDILGKWIGRTRVVSQPISGIYFSFDTDGLGFDQGVWQGPYDPDAGFTNLSDETYESSSKQKLQLITGMEQTKHCRRFSTQRWTVLA